LSDVDTGNRSHRPLLFSGPAAGYSKRFI